MAAANFPCEDKAQEQANFFLLLAHMSQEPNLAFMVEPQMQELRLAIWEYAHGSSRTDERNLREVQQQLGMGPADPNAGVTLTRGRVSSIDWRSRGLGGAWFASDNLPMQNVTVLPTPQSNLSQVFPAWPVESKCEWSVLSECRTFTGTFPSKLGLLTNLKQLWLHENNLEGARMLPALCPLRRDPSCLSRNSFVHRRPSP